jgi:hypothetical protein
MFQATLIKNEINESSLSFKNETMYYKFSVGHFLYDHNAISNKGNLNLLKIISNKNKIFMSSGVGPFHILFENIFPILDILEKHKDIYFIIDIHEFKNNNNLNFIDFIKSVSPENIEFVDSSDFDGIEINNHLIFNYYNYRQGAIDKESVAHNAKELIRISAEPSKKIYLSRRKYLDLNQKRVFNEALLESFFLEKGFDIVYPEDFLSIQDQIDFFSTVKTVVSPTSSSMSWIVFMQPEGNVLELQTDFDIGRGQRQIHHQYNVLSYNGGHNYYAIPNYDRLASSLIKSIEDSKILNII